MKIRTIKDEENGKIYLSKEEVQNIINPVLALVNQETNYNIFIRAAYHADEADFRLSTSRDTYGWEKLCQLCKCNDCVNFVIDSINYYIGKIGGKTCERCYIDDVIRYSLHRVFYALPDKYPFTDFKAGKSGSKLTEGIANTIYHTNTNTIFAFKRNTEFNYICYMAVGLYRTVKKKLFSTTCALSDELYSHLDAYKSLAESVCAYYDTNIDHYLADDTWYKYAWNGNIHIKTEKDLRPMQRNQYSKFPFRNLAVLLIKYNSPSIRTLSEDDRAIILADMDKINRGAYRNDVYQNGRICPLYTSSDVYIAASILMTIAEKQSLRNIYEVLYNIYKKTAAKFSFGDIFNAVEGFDNDITLAIAGDIVSNFIAKQIPKNELVLHQVLNSDTNQTLMFCNSFHNVYLVKEAKPDENVSNRK